MIVQLLFLLVLIVVAWQGWRSYRSWRLGRGQAAYAEWKAAQQYTLIKVLVPKNNEKTPLAAEQMFAALHGTYREGSEFQDQISFELVAYEKFIHFYVYAPTHLKEFVEGQIYAQYPNVEISEAEDYTALRPKEQVALSAELTLTKDDVYPIKTFPNFTVDPLSGITAVLGNVASGEQLWVQLIVKPVPENWQDKGVSYVAAKRTGSSTSPEGWLRPILRVMTGFVMAFVRTALQPATATTGETTPSTPEEGSPESRVQLSAPEEAALKGIEEKVTKLGYQTKIRFVSLARDSHTARSRIESLTGAFKQFNTTNLNGFRIEAIHEGEGNLDTYLTRDFTGPGPVLNTEELASVYHLPASTVETPNIAWAGSKKGEPPANLPLEGQTAGEETTFFGTTDFRNFRHKFGIKRSDRRLHMYTIGKTGTGKSTLLLNMVIDDIQNGRGVGIVDPHGQLIQDVLERMPSHRMNDVIYFNPADRDFPVGFNILENVEPDLRSVVASGVVGVFKKLFAESWGPRLEYILRNAILALLFYPDTTLLGVNRLLVDDDYRRRIVRKVTDPVVRDFFLEEYDKYDPKFRREAISSIQNKVGQFLSSTTIRNTIGQPKSSFEMRQVMDEGKILLMDLSIGKIGEDNAQMLGSMMITKVQLAAMSRADVVEDKRPDFYLYVDEFQNFATESFAVILSEARKYHLNLVLTNQYIGQMPEEVAKAVFGNVGTIVSFRVGAADASGLVKEFEPVFEAIDLVNLDNYHVYVKMAIDGVTRPAFSAKTLPPAEPIGTEHIEKIVKISRERYAKPRDFVEQKIQEWSDDVQVRQAQEWRKSIQDKEAPAPQRNGAGPTPTPPTAAPGGGEGFVDSRQVTEVQSLEPKRAANPLTNLPGTDRRPEQRRKQVTHRSGSGQGRRSQAASRPPDRDKSHERSKTTQAPRREQTQRRGAPEQGRPKPIQSQVQPEPHQKAAFISGEDIESLRQQAQRQGNESSRPTQEDLQSLEEL